MPFGFTFNGSDTIMSNALNKAIAGMKDLDMNRISIEMYKDVIEHFQREEGPDGNWPGLSTYAESVRQTRSAKNKKAKIKKYGTGKLLQDTGRLRGSIKNYYDESSASVGIGSNLVYAAIHNFGGNIKVTNKMRAFLHFKGIHLKKSTTSIKIPQREFAWLSKECIERIKNYILKKATGQSTNQ